MIIWSVSTICRYSAKTKLSNKQKNAFWRNIQKRQFAQNVGKLARLGILDMPPHVTFWSEEDKEWVCTFLDGDLRGLSGLGSEPHIARYELETAYLAWVKGE